MAVHVADHVWSHEAPSFERCSKAAVKLVLLFMADCASRDGSGIYPASSTIADFTGLDVSTVKRILKNLRAAGLIKVLRPATPRFPATYAFTFLPLELVAGGRKRGGTRPPLRVPVATSEGAGGHPNRYRTVREPGGDPSEDVKADPEIAKKAVAAIKRELRQKIADEARKPRSSSTPRRRAGAAPLKPAEAAAAGALPPMRRRRPRTADVAGAG